MSMMKTLVNECTKLNTFGPKDDHHFHRLLPRSMNETADIVSYSFIIPREIKSVNDINVCLNVEDNGGKYLYLEVPYIVFESEDKSEVEIISHAVRGRMKIPDFCDANDENKTVTMSPEEDCHNIIVTIPKLIHEKKE